MPGDPDTRIQVPVRDSDDLYRIAGSTLTDPGVKSLGPSYR